MKLFVFSTHRALLEFAKGADSAFLPPCKTISEFFESAVIYENIALKSKAFRTLFLWRAIKNIEVSNLGFEKSFVRFLEHSNFLLHFFDELACANVAISDIDTEDTYGDYSDHLRILERIYEAYKNELEKFGISADCARYQINTRFLQAYSEIEIYIDGIFNKKELQILQQCAQISDIKIYFNATKYNVKLLEQILQDFANFAHESQNLNFSQNLAQNLVPNSQNLTQNLAQNPQNLTQNLAQNPQNLTPNHSYCLHLNANILTSLGTLKPRTKRICAYSFSKRVSQVLLVMAKVNEWLKDGVENIAVILPDCAFAKYLELFEKNLNFAMGFEDTRLKKALQNLCDDENFAQIAPKEALNFILQKFKFDDELEIRAMSEILEHLSVNEIIEFLAKNIKNVDDNNGGKVRVIGILESRAMNFERAIIVDFNSEFIPLLNDNDMFLNTPIRKRLNLPTLRDKENLQRHYYFMLIQNTEVVEIAYCKNGVPSNLLDELEHITSVEKLDGDALWRFYENGSEQKYIDDEIIAQCPPLRLSASAIKCFLACKRQFYFRYICENLRSSEEKEEFLGTKIHNLLCEMGRDFDTNKIRQFAESSAQCERLDLEITLKKLSSFFKNQAQAIKNGTEILCVEQSKNFKLGGFDFVCKIDRVDKIGDKIRIIDYKLKKDFKAQKEGFLQLLIYKLAFEAESSTKIAESSTEIECAYFDLWENKIFIMDSEAEKTARETLDSALCELKGEINFARCEDISACKYCDYIYLCERY